MKTLKALSISTVLAVAMAGLTGCTAAQKGAAGGGLIGGIAGSVIGNNAVSMPATGATVGAASGAAVGGLAGDAYEQVTQADRERELENLRAQVIEAEEALAALRANGMSRDAMAELESARTELDSLRAALEAARAENDALAMNSSSKDAHLAELRASLAQRDGDHGARVAALEASLSQKDGEYQKLLSDLDRLQADANSRTAELEQQVSTLRSQLADKEARLAMLDGEVEVLRTSLSGKEQQLSAVSSELKDLNVQLEETTRGLTLTIVDSLLYEPGEADLTADGQALIGDVARIIRDNFPNRELLVEGHTDNQPIVRSGWRSNWELGAARALTLLHELVAKHNVDPAKVSAGSYGEFRPTATNSTPEGRRINRRAVIVILPEKLPLQRESLAAAN